MSRYALSSVCLIICTIGIWFWFGWTGFPVFTQSSNTQHTANQTDPIKGLEKSSVTTTSTSALMSQASQVINNTSKSDTAPDALQQLTGLLSGKQYHEAVELYSVLYNQMSEADSEQYRNGIFAFVQELIEQQNHVQVVALLENYLSIFYKDLEALSILANSQHVLELYSNEITTLFTAIDEAYSVEDISRFKTRLYDAIEAQAAVLSNDSNAVLEFYQILSERKPENEMLQLGLSRALLRSGQKDRAIAILNALPIESEHKAEINELLTSTQQNRFSDTSAVPIQRFGESFSVRAVINGVSAVTLLIDTGATFTTMHPNALRRAGVNPQHSERTVVLNTANGNLRVPVLRLQSLTLGNQRINDVEVGSIAISGMGGIDGLLGMNFLNRFKFTLDQQQQVILLAR